jgi:hypothetical protein
VKVEAWLVLKAKRSSWQSYPAASPYHGQQKIEGARVVKIAVNKPTLDGDEIAFKLDVDVDESWFLEGTATIKAQVPAQPQANAEIQAVVDMPVKGRAKSAAAAVIHP